MRPRELLEELRRLPQYQGQLVGEPRLYPARVARYGELERPLPEALRASLTAAGVERFYSHQAEAINLLPHHASWGSFLANLEYVVLDEVHTYRGLFGSHVAAVLRRLSRLCEHYGSHPRFICCSATIANPRELVRWLTGCETAVVDDD